MPRSPRTVTCARCHRRRPHKAHGMCDNCCRIMRRQESYIPSPRRRGNYRLEDAIAEYLDLVEMGETRERIADRMGKSPRTIDRYAQAYRTGHAPWASHRTVNLDDLDGDPVLFEGDGLDDLEHCGVCLRTVETCTCLMNGGRLRRVVDVPTGGAL